LSGFYPAFSLVTYPFTYPFFPRLAVLFEKLQVVISHKIFFKKSSPFFGKIRPHASSTKLPLVMSRAWPGEVFLFYLVFFPAVNLALCKDIRPPPAALPTTQSETPGFPGVAVAWWSRPDEPAAFNQTSYQKGFY